MICDIAVPEKYEILAFSGILDVIFSSGWDIGKPLCRTQQLLLLVTSKHFSCTILLQVWNSLKNTMRLCDITHSSTDTFYTFWFIKVVLICFDHQQIGPVYNYFSLKLLTLNGFSPECWRMCVRSILDAVNALLQYTHLYGRSPLWTCNKICVCNFMSLAIKIVWHSGKSRQTS